MREPRCENDQAGGAPCRKFVTPKPSPFFAHFSARTTASRRDRPNNRESKDEQTGIIPNLNPPADTAGGQKWGAAWELHRNTAPKLATKPMLCSTLYATK